MRRESGRFRVAVTASALAAAAVAGVVVTGPAHATASFSFQRIQGQDRYQTAGAINQAAFPSGEPNTLLADGVPGHETDALAASGLEGVGGIGVFVTDNTTSVPANTLSALSTSKVKNIAVLGGTAAVSQSQIDQLRAAGYTVTTPFAGATRYQTMKMIDDAIPPASVGKDSAGNPTAILASGDEKHFVDALSGGGLAYAQKFPIILTNSTSAALQPEAQQVITALGIKHLIVAGGTASIPNSQYNPPPSGVSQVTVEAGSDRSQTSEDVADNAIFNSWLKDTAMTLARGDDGSDALAGAAFSGVSQLPTIVTDSPTNVGSAPAFATEHKSTLAGTSDVFGGTTAVPDSQVSAVEVAGGSASTAPSGPIAPTSGQNVVGVSSGSFVQGGNSYAYGSGDTYQIDTTSSQPGASPACTADSYANFQNHLSDGDQVTGTYKPGGVSTFCLNDMAPHPPSTVKATPNTTAGGVTVTWTAPSTASTDGTTGYQVWRALAMNPSPLTQCPAVYTVAPGVSPQTPPPSSGTNGYSSVGTVTTSSGTASYSFNDTTATSGTTYCYGVSSNAPNALGTNAPATAEPNDPNQTSQSGGAGGTPVTAASGTGGTVPTMQAIAVKGQTITVTYSSNISAVDANGSDFGLTITPALSPTPNVRAYASGSQAIIDLSEAIPTTTTTNVKVTSQSGGDGNTVCAPNSTQACDPTGDSQSTTTVSPGGTAPTMTGATASAGAQTVTVSLSEAIDCITVDAGQFTLTEGGLPGGPQVSSAACSGTGTTSNEVVLSTAGLVPGAPYTVTSTKDTSSGQLPSVVGNGQGASEATGESKGGMVGS